MTLIRHESISVSEVLCHLSATTNAPSSMGAQLEQLAAASDARTHGPGWGTKAKPALPKRQDPEGIVLRDASMHRLVAGLGNIKGVDMDTAENLVKVSYDRKQSVGRVLVRVLRSYHAALAAPTEEELARANERAAKCVAHKRSEVFQKAIGEYRAPRGLEAVRVEAGLKTSGEAAALYGDCLIVLAMYVQVFNRKAVA